MVFKHSLPFPSPPPLLAPPRCLVSVLKHKNVSLRSHSNPWLICEEYIVSYIPYLSTFEHFRSCFISLVDVYGTGGFEHSLTHQLAWCGAGYMLQETISPAFKCLHNLQHKFTPKCLLTLDSQLESSVQTVLFCLRQHALTAPAKSDCSAAGSCTTKRCNFKGWIYKLLALENSATGWHLWGTAKQRSALEVAWC